MSASLRKIRIALKNTTVWSDIRQRLRGLSDSELGQAEEIERLGRRRRNILQALRAERYCRDGRTQKMLRLNVGGFNG